MGIFTICPWLLAWNNYEITLWWSTFKTHPFQDFRFLSWIIDYILASGGYFSRVEISEMTYIMLDYRLRCRPNINPTLFQRLRFAGIWPLFAAVQCVTLNSEHNLLSQHCFNVTQASQTANHQKTALGQPIIIWLGICISRIIIMTSIQCNSLTTETTFYSK